MNDSETTPVADDAHDTQDVLHTFLRFVRVVRYRKIYVIAALLVTASLGTVYYATATRVYQASADVLVLQSSEGVFQSSSSVDDRSQALIPTYERLFFSSPVLKSAVEQIRELPVDLLVDFQRIPAADWEGALRKKMTAKSAKRTNVIEVTCPSKSPEAAEAVVSAVVQSYLEFMEKNHKDVSAEIATILDRERKDVDQELDRKQRELLELQHRLRTLGLSDGDAKTVDPIVQRVLSLNDALITAQKDRVSLEATLSALQAAIRTGGDLREHLTIIEPTVGRDLLALTLGLNPDSKGVLDTMERKLMDDRAKLEMLSSRLGPSHPQILEVANSIQSGERFLAQYQSNAIQRLNSVSEDQLPEMLVSLVQEKIARAWAYERELSERYTDAEDEAVQLNDRHAELTLVELDVQRLRKVHESLLDRIAHIDLGKNHSTLRVAVVGEPTASRRPVSPRLSIVGLICLAGGLGIGLTIVYVLDVIDDRFRSPEELREQLGTPVLAVVRKLTALADGGADALQVHTASTSVESEAFRTLRTTLAFSGGDLQRLAITSSEPGDGKTTVLANLGASFAQAGKRTLLIDADMRRPGLSKLFAMRGWAGLSDVLRSESEIAPLCVERVRETGVPGLFLLPCGPKPADPAELLSRPRLSDLIAWAETHFDQVLVDCPPMLAASDAAIVGRLTDGIILVVQPEKNHRRLVLRAVEGLRALKVSLLGVVANNVSGAEEGGYYGYGAGYGYGYGYGYGNGYGHENSDDDDDVATDQQDTADQPAAADHREAREVMSSNVLSSKEMFSPEMTRPAATPSAPPAHQPSPNDRELSVTSAENEKVSLKPVRVVPRRAA